MMKVWISCVLLFVSISLWGNSVEENFFTEWRENIEMEEDVEQKNAMLTMLDEVESNGCFLEVGNDDLKEKYALLQYYAEQALGSKRTLGQIYGLVGMYHANAPKPSSPGMREYLKNGGSLFSVYPEKALETLPKSELALYLDLLSSFPNNLFDYKLYCLNIDPEMVGAIYFFRDSNSGIQYILSFKGRETEAPGQWGVWFGPLMAEPVKGRVFPLFAYLNAFDGPTFAKFGVGRLVEDIGICLHNLPLLKEGREKR